MTLLTAHSTHAIAPADAERAAADVDAVLAACTPPVARISGIRHVLAEQAGLDMAGPGWPARLVAFCLAHRPGPFTLLACRLTGQTPTVETAAEADCELDAGQAAILRADPGTPAWERSGLMMCGTTVAARVRLILVPDRLDPGDLAMIRKGVPCGEVLPGLSRVHRAGRVTWPEDPAATGGAALVAPRPGLFGFAAERVTAGFCGRIGGSTR